MVFRMVLFVWEFLMDVMAISRLSTGEKNLELLLLFMSMRTEPTYATEMDPQRTIRKEPCASEVDPDTHNQ
jgi:hypothetical protein